MNGESKSVRPREARYGPRIPGRSLVARSPSREFPSFPVGGGARMARAAPRFHQLLAFGAQAAPIGDPNWELQTFRPFPGNSGLHEARGASASAAPGHVFIDFQLLEVSAHATACDHGRTAIQNPKPKIQNPPYLP